MSRAERGSNSQFASAPGGAHQQEVRDICASDEQDEDHASLKNEQRRANIANELVAHRAGIPAKSAQLRELRARRQTLHVLIDDGFHLRIQLRDSGARPQPRDHLAELVATRAVRHLLRCEGERHQHRDVARSQVEICRQHADHTIGFAVHPDVASHDPPVAAEPRIPQRIRQDHELVRARLRFFFSESASKKWLTSQRRQKGRGDGERAQLFGAPLLRKVRGTVGKEGRILNGGRLILAIQIVGNRYARLR